MWLTYQHLALMTVAFKHFVIINSQFMYIKKKKKKRENKHLHAFNLQIDTEETKIVIHLKIVSFPFMLIKISLDYRIYTEIVVKFKIFNMNT